MDCQNLSDLREALIIRPRQGLGSISFSQEFDFGAGWGGRRLEIFQWLDEAQISDLNEETEIGPRRNWQMFSTSFASQTSSTLI